MFELRLDVITKTVINRGFNAFVKEYILNLIDMIETMYIKIISSDILMGGFNTRI